MVDIANFRFTSPADSFGQGFETGNALRQNSAKLSAGRAMQGGDITGAANALYGGGMIGAGTEVANYGQAQQDRVTKATDARRDELLKFTTDAAGRLAEYHHSTGDVNKTLSAFDQMAAQFSQYGETPEEIAQVRQQLASDPDGTLVALGAGAAKQLGYDVQGSGDEVLVIDKKTGKLVTRYRGARTTTVGDGGSLVEIPGSYGGAPDPAAQPAAPARQVAGQPDQQPAPASAPAPDADAVWAAMKHREWGGQGPAPDSPQGAIGSTQMLPATAESMARKLGVAWRPDLMRGNTPNALAYQDKLGRAYFDEGVAKYGGDLAKGAAYYHGGPDEGIWGPKTQAYAQAVTGRLQGGQGDAQPYQVASAGDTPPPPEGGARVLLSRPKQEDHWVDLPGGGQRNTRTGQTQGTPRTSGRLSATVIKLQNDLLSDLQSASSVNTVIDRAINQIDGGKLNLGPVTNLVSRGRNIAGQSDENSRNFETFRTSLEKMRNDSLRLNKGVQTEGDAQRAWNEIMAHTGDEALVRQRLAEIKDLNEQAIALRSDLVNQAREDSGFAPLDTSRYRAKSALNDPGASQLPPQAASQLKAGHNTTFANGQVWTLRGGQPARVK